MGLRDVLLQELKTDEDKLVYECSDGVGSARDVEHQTGVDHSTVARLWKKWAELGIVEPSERFQGRMKRLCSLRDLAIRLPQRKPIQEQSNEAPLSDLTDGGQE